MTRHRRWYLASATTLIAVLVGAFLVNVHNTSSNNSAKSLSPPRLRDFSAVDRASKTFPTSVSWVTECSIARVSYDDPILHFGHPGASHEHMFSGNLNVTATSTAEQLARQSTNCTNSGDLSAYWMPALYSDGQRQTPYVTRAYYRAGTFTTARVRPIPFGLKMIAGDPLATSPQRANIAGFHCRVENRGAIVAKSALPPHCPAGALLEASVAFPNCWDGKHLDSADHRSHMAYAQDYACDSAHPVQIPQLTLAERFKPGTTSGKITLASMNNPYSLHADFMNAWKPADMKELVVHCIHGGLACEGISDDRAAPGT